VGYIKVLSHVAHGTYQTNLSKIPGVKFFHMVNGRNLKNVWEDKHSQRPDNVFEVDEDYAKDHLKEYDVLLLHAHQFLEKYKDWKIRKVFVEHTAPWYSHHPSIYAKIRKETVNFTVFITESNMRAWGMRQNDRNGMIRHAINVNEYPNYSDVSDDSIVTLTNAFIQRDVATGFSLWSKVVWKFPNAVVYGFDNSNLGPQRDKGFLSFDRAVKKLSTAGVFFNPATASPIPMSLMEAMAVGVPVVTTAFYEAGLIMQNGKHGIVSNNVRELQEGIKFMLKNRDVAKEMGQNAKRLVEETFPMETFITKWKKVFEG